MDKICVIDFETTGIDVFKDNPIEIGCIIINNDGKKLNNFHSYIRPKNKRKFSARAKNIHGINDFDLINAPTQDEVLETFFKLVGTDFRFAGWNIGFDVSFFRRMCHVNDRMKLFNAINHRHIDIQSIVYYLVQLELFPKELKSLEDLIVHFGMKRNKKHSAIEDAELTAKVYGRLISIDSLFKRP
ncbi:MAG: 3'-5' exonuclease [Candidatus Paceibacterota bacterium]